MNVPDKNIIQLIDILKDSRKIRYDTEFCESIGLRKQNLRNIKININHFTPDHIEKVIKKYNVNANWIFGVSEEVFFIKKK